MSSTTIRLKVVLSFFALTVFVATPTWAEDIEIYKNASNNVNSNANIVFIIDTSGSMYDKDLKVATSAGDKFRLDVVKDEFANLMNMLAPKGGINVAVMRFDGTDSVTEKLSDDENSKVTKSNEGGYFITPMQALTEANKTSIINAVQNLNGTGYTPLAETLYEAALYYRGDNVLFGNTTSAGPNKNTGAIEKNVAGVLNAAGNKYVSPISGQCESTNNIVLLTDGKPYYDGDADTQIRSLAQLSASDCGFGTGSTSENDCLAHVAGFLNAVDQRQDLPGDQTVKTYTISFGASSENDSSMDIPLLNRTAAAGGTGSNYLSSNATDLATAFADITDKITMSSNVDSFASPSLSVNNFNRLTHDDKVFFALYETASTKFWGGNVKGFKFGEDPANPGETILLDKNNQPAINNGKIKDSATSLWTTGADAPDGSDVLKGGAESNLPVLRNIYTYTGAVNNGLTTINAQLNGSVSHKLHETNTSISNAMLGLATGVDSTALLQWARGLNADGTTRHSMGDPLHSQPVVVTYGGSAASPDATIFVATNEGYLQAFDAATGVEKFAFMPKQLLANLNILMTNTDSRTNAPMHPYGLDGDITTWIRNDNNNGIIDGSEEVYLIVGMRRGGDNYYAIDVTTPTSPELKWIIKGGGSGTNFDQLAQTWSKPVAGKIKLSGTDTDVLVFGGGYNTIEDDDTPPIPTSGNGQAIYIVNALTGQRIWWAGPSGANANNADMTHSIPSDIRVLDVNIDGYIDRLYVGDMDAKVFRVDIDNDGNSGAGNLATIGTLATLGGTGANNRRFYNAPDVALTKKPGTNAYLSINIGSGYRAHPMNTAIDDRFYSLRDENIFDPPASFTPITEGLLYDATANLIGQSGTDTEKKAELDKLFAVDKKGWYISLDAANGEKVLAESTTYNNSIFFTTYTPQAAPANSCSSLPGLGKLYHISLFDATPVRNYDTAVITLNKDDRIVKELDKGGIPNSPAVIFAKNLKPTLCVGNECATGVPLQLTLDKTYWTQQ